MPIKPLVVSEAPAPSGVDVTSEAGKVEASTKKWGREVVLALRNLFTQVQNLPGVTATTEASAAASENATDARSKVNTPAAAISDSEVVLFSGVSGMEIKGGGPPPRNFSVVLDMALLNPGAGVSITYGLNVAAMKLKAKASGGSALPGSSLPNKIIGAHDHDHAANSLVNTQFVIYTTDGTALPSAGQYRVNFIVFP